MSKDVYFDDYNKKEMTFTIVQPDGGWRRVFTQDYIQEIRPVAETLAMIDKHPTRDYALYLHEADAIYRFRVGEASWIQDSEDPVINDLLQQIKLIKRLKGKR